MIANLRWTTAAAVVAVQIAACGGKPATETHSANDGPQVPTTPHTPGIPSSLKYDATDLSQVAGPDEVVAARTIDDEGRVAGMICKGTPYCSAAHWDAFLWDGSLHRFSVPAGWQAEADATAGGRIAGRLVDADGELHAFISDGDRLVVLESLGDAAEIVAMSSGGTVVGALRNAAGEVRAVAWKANTLEDLGARTGRAQSRAFAVDEAGRVAVLACDGLFPVSGCHALLLTDSDMSDLGAIPDGTYVFAMSTRGAVVGTIDMPNAPPPSGTVAAIWRGGSTTDLSDAISARGWPTLGVQSGSRLESYLGAVAPNGDAVGAVVIAISEGDAANAIAWRDGALVDLASVVEPQMPVHSAFAINAKGQILARKSAAPFGGEVLLTPR
jgi:uncharacterized membrane protein